MAPRRSLGHALGIPFRRSRGGIAPIPPNIITATVEDETPTKVYINFAWNLDDTSVPDPSAFTLAGKIISGVVITGATVTLTVTVAYVYGDVITVDYTMPGADPLKQESTGASILSWVGQVVTNYVHTPEVSTYIDGLVTPLSAGQLALLNTMLLYWKAGLGAITNLSEFADVLYDLAGETAESSLRNMVRRAHDAVAVNSPVFTPLEGFKGDGISAYIDTNYKISADAINASLNNAAMGIYSRTGKAASTTRSAGSVYLYRFGINTNRAAAGMMCELMNNASIYGPYATDGKGLSTGIRYNNISAYSVINKTFGAEGTTAAIGLTTANLNILRATGTTSYTDEQISLFFITRALSQSDINAFYDGFQAYMTANGKQV